MSKYYIGADKEPVVAAFSMAEYAAATNAEFGRGKDRNPRKRRRIAYGIGGGLAATGAIRYGAAGAGYAAATRQLGQRSVKSMARNFGRGAASQVGLDAKAVMGAGKTGIGVGVAAATHPKATAQMIGEGVRKAPTKIVENSRRLGGAIKSGGGTVGNAAKSGLSRISATLGKIGRKAV